MERSVKQRLATTLAERIQAEITSEPVGERLPGLRLLAKRYGVSVPTVADALHQLATEGVVEAGGDRRSWRVKRIPSKTLRPSLSERKARSRLLFLSALALHDERFSGIEVHVELVDELEPSGCEVSHRVIPFDRARKPHASWNHLLRGTRADAVIVMGGTPAVAEWLRSENTRTLFIGGDSGHTGIPVLATSTPAMFGLAIRRLLESGHRKILVPLCGRPERFAKRCTKAIQDAIVSNSAADDCLVIAESSYSGPDVLVNLLLKHWPWHSPDALVFIDWHEFVAADSFLRAKGLVIPRDVSVIILSHDPSMNWHLPALSHFDLPVRAIARVAARWVNSGRLPKESENKQILIAPRWVEAYSVAARK
jgi:DNA-binding LacI/PurR family transcriptional regulator